LRTTSIFILNSRIFSPPVPYASQYCLTFYYSMYGFHIYWLKVYVTSTATMSSTLVWSMFGQQGNFWLKAQLTVQMQQAAQVFNVACNLRTCKYINFASLTSSLWSQLRLCSNYGFVYRKSTILKAYLGKTTIFFQFDIRM